MSQYADGGRMASKPYVATGAYIQRMSNHCSRCRFDPKKSEGEDACPFTTLYWDYLLRHENRLKSNPRMSLQLKNLDRLDESRRRVIGAQAKIIRANGGSPPAQTAAGKLDLG
jgi:deoxyribodipyrimidine photolyase-related protein